MAVLPEGAHGWACLPGGLPPFGQAEVACCVSREAKVLPLYRAYSPQSAALQPCEGVCPEVCVFPHIGPEGTWCLAPPGWGGGPDLLSSALGWGLASQEGSGSGVPGRTLRPLATGSSMRGLEKRLLVFMCVWGTRGKTGARELSDARERGSWEHGWHPVSTSRPLPFAQPQAEGWERLSGRERHGAGTPRCCLGREAGPPGALAGLVLWDAHVLCWGGALCHLGWCREAQEVATALCWPRPHDFIGWRPGPVSSTGPCALGVAKPQQ